MHISKNQGETMNSNEEIKQAFDKFAGWLKDCLFHVDDNYLKENPSPGVSFEISTFMTRGYKYPFNISYVPQYEGMVMFNSGVALEEGDHASLMMMRKGERTQILMDLRKYVFPLRVNLEVSLPRFFLYKLVTIDALKDNKNYFVEQVFNFRNAAELLKIRIDEAFFEENPDGFKQGDDYYK